MKHKSVSGGVHHTLNAGICDAVYYSVYAVVGSAVYDAVRDYYNEA